MYVTARGPGQLNSQRGTALIAGLVFLVILVMLGLSASSAAIQQEIIARNIRDEKLAFESAEAALRGAETWLRNQPFRSAAGMVDGNMYIFNSLNPAAALCDPADAKHPCNSGAESWWSANARKLGSAGGAPPEFSAETIDDQPSYIIELIQHRDAEDLMMNGTSSPTFIYRITARGVGSSPNTVRIVRSTYRIG